MNIKSARKAAEFSVMVKLVQTDRTPTAPVYQVPGHGGRTYYVRLEFKNHNIYTTCRLKDGTPCKGNSNGTVCYHALAALISHNGYPGIKFSRILENAVKASHIKINGYNAHIRKIHNQAESTVYGVTYTSEKVDSRNRAAAEFKALCTPMQTAEQKAKTATVLAQNRAILRGAEVEI